MFDSNRQQQVRRQILLIMFVGILTLTALLQACTRTQDEAFDEVGFYVQTSNGIEKLFNTRVTQGLGIDDVKERVIKLPKDAALLIYMPNFTSEKLLVYKAKPWTLYPVDQYHFVKTNGDERALVKKISSDVYQVLPDSIPRTPVVGLSYMHSVEKIIFSGFVRDDYQDVVREALKDESNYSVAKRKFAQALLLADVLDSVKYAAKMSLKMTENDQKARKTSTRFNHAAASTARSAKPKIPVSLSILESVAREYVVGINVRDYTRARLYSTGRALRAVSTFERNSTNVVLDSKSYSSFDTASHGRATLFANDGTRTTFVYQNNVWLVSTY